MPLKYTDKEDESKLRGKYIEKLQTKKRKKKKKSPLVFFFFFTGERYSPFLLTYSVEC